MFRRLKKNIQQAGQLEINFIEKKQTTWTPQTVRELLEQNNKWRVRAFFKLWNLTEACEKDKLGFNRQDYIKAEEIWRSYKQFGDFTPRELGWMKKKLPKYAKQLFEVKRGLR